MAVQGTFSWEGGGGEGIEGQINFRKYKCTITLVINIFYD